MGKKIVFLLALTLVIKVIYSQHYRAFDSTTTWGTEFVYKVDGTCYVQENKKYKIQGSVLNNGNKWLQVGAQGQSHWHPNSPVMTCMSLSFFMPGPYNTTVGFLLNDTINKRVYFKNNLPANYTPTLSDVLYDFNKVVGDTFVFSGCLPYKLKIYKIDSVLFSGKYHKRFVTAVVPFPIGNSRVSIIEGIGCTIDPFFPSINGMNEQYRNLLCFASPLQSQTVMNDTTFTNGVCNNLLLNLKQATLSKIAIYPSPADDNIIVMHDEEGVDKLEYTIVDVMGRPVLKGTLLQNDRNIPIKNLNNGIYFVNFSDSNGSFSKKIVVAR